MIRAIAPTNLPLILNQSGVQRGSESCSTSSLASSASATGSDDVNSSSSAVTSAINIGMLSDSSARSPGRLYDDVLLEKGFSIHS